jgi:hypothetical protein
LEFERKVGDGRKRKNLRRVGGRNDSEKEERKNHGIDRRVFKKWTAGM